MSFAVKKGGILPLSGFIDFESMYHEDMEDFLENIENSKGTPCYVIPNSSMYRDDAIGLIFVFDHYQVYEDDMSIKCTLIHNGRWTESSCTHYADEDDEIVLQDFDIIKKDLDLHYTFKKYII